MVFYFVSFLMLSLKKRRLKTRVLFDDNLDRVLSFVFFLMETPDTHSNETRASYT